jgi:hypothetical protein
MKSLLLLAVLTATSIAADAPFTPLFPKDGPPSGFVVRHWSDVSQPPKDAAEWTVKDGVLTSVGTRGCWLMSEKEYGDFELEYEFKLGPTGNSGLALRAPMKGDPAFDGMEMQMADFRYNPQAKENELTGGIYRAVAPSKQLYKPQEWNTVRVRLEGPRVHIELNGEVIQDFDVTVKTGTVLRHDKTDAPPVKDRPRRGHIGFQELSKDGSHVLVRGARIRELSK